MTCAQYRDAIQELADGTLGPVRRAELQTHLDQCDDCRALAADLQKIRATATALDPMVPPTRVWNAIAQELRKQGRAAPARRTAPIAMLAIAASLVLVIGGALYLLRSAGDLRPPQQAAADTASAPAADAGNAPPANTVQRINEDLTAAVQHYESAIATLEQAVKADDGAIDPETAAVLKRNLPVIDQAIAETKSALKSEPESAPARESLFEALRKKVGLLQDTIALMNEMRKGNSAGAAQLIDDRSKS
jgi:tetratricopeptide (TPR) repeat protein